MSVAQSKSTTENASEKSLTQFDYLRFCCLLGDAIAYGFTRYHYIWDKCYGNRAANCGIAGDISENLLGRTENLSLPSGIEYIATIFGTNNIDYNEASSIPNGLLCAALTLISKSVQ